MEIRDKSRSVNSIDIIFNFDCIGFTGTPFLDNYPTANYIRNARQDEIPNMINREFYTYTSENLSIKEFQNRFMKFQGTNNNVLVEYVNSDFIRTMHGNNEMSILERIFRKEMMSSTGSGSSMFNTIVDLCGIFKRSSIHDVCNLIRKLYGSDQFHYLYHISQSDNSHRVLCIKTDNDIQYDEEFYNFLCKKYDAGLKNRM